MIESQFKIGQPVRVKHQPDLGVCEVTSIEPTDMLFWKRLKGPYRMEKVPVGHYVRITSGKKSGLGYHEESLVPA